MLKNNNKSNPDSLDSLESFNRDHIFTKMCVWLGVIDRIIQGLSFLSHDCYFLAAFGACLKFSALSQSTTGWSPSQQVLGVSVWWS